MDEKIKIQQNIFFVYKAVEFPQSDFSGILGLSNDKNFYNFLDIAYKVKQIKVINYL